MTDASTMAPRERVSAALRGEAVDRPPVSLWRHFPKRDQTAADLAAATIAWQEQFGFDLVKFMPPGDYPTIDWGAESEFQGSPNGTRETTRFPVTAPSEWETLPPLNLQHGFLRVVLDGVSRTRAALDADVPLLQTIFSPLTIAAKLSNRLAIEHLRAHPAELHAGLRRITEVTREMVTASLAAGADGLFFATQLADYTVLDETEYREFGLAYDMQVLEAATASQITMLHLHGDEPMFALQARYPAHTLNWHDRRSAPDLVTGHRLSGRCVSGGLDERRIETASAAESAAEARDAIEMMRGRSLIVAPGCVIPVATPEANIRAVVETVTAATA